MNNRKTVLLPGLHKILAEFGENIQLARLRRKLSGAQVADRANISSRTLIKIEKGSHSVSIGAYIQVLSVLGLEKDILAVAKDDELGRKLQDADIKSIKRAPKR